MTGPAQGEHGGEAYRIARALGVDVSQVVDLGTNGNILCADLTAAHVAAVPYPHEHYPDLEASLLREAVATHENVPVDHVLAGNGSAELIWLAFMALRPRRVLLLGPLFGEYERACRALDIAYRVVTPRALRPLYGKTPSPCGVQASHSWSETTPSPFTFTAEDLDDIAAEDADLAVFCTPNNPTGAIYGPVEGLLAAVRSPIVLVDNTYREFIWGEDAYEANAWQVYRNTTGPDREVLALHSLTKFFHCAGIRCGYAVGSPALLQRLAAIRAPWMVSTYAEQLGARLLGDIAQYRSRLPRLRAARSAMRCALEATGAFAAGGLHEGTSFVTCRLQPHLHPETARQALMGEGYLVRVCDNITGMPPGHIRLQVRHPETMPALFRMLERMAR
ncbi:pyridoxal phosphate-dependent aminotransferase [Nitratidesulfovibrio vulgaris]|uniref:Aminotransferase, putative n=1 Tax=Nitratidesulfovibrio vulgaris (strain ATCC 29579 / DSM 644 / CCUG 34227 / NCIMB 8303 / VKM B-1760 / Hildenborough) TaxID=882 RepID=Q72D70_NITV2|nr:aminotransferase class I/II-fold pyridoxal phosphate-dependent enzyme [Nitratidesulfovibrio vulgaris]AAS95539.1 aminotransferase, putative [Nitratidesulfovibrio vulgaris str. Hildenborough]ADP86141.1 aminotransferase class I and II [Nitratidesulfovibrio vulgaris RCH1]